MLTAQEALLLAFGSFFGCQSQTETAKYSWPEISQSKKGGNAPIMSGNVSTVGTRVWKIG